MKPLYSPPLLRHIFALTSRG